MNILKKIGEGIGTGLAFIAWLRRCTGRTLQAMVEQYDTWKAPEL